MGSGKLACSVRPRIASPYYEQPDAGRSAMRQLLWQGYSELDMYNSLRQRLHKSSGRSPILGWPEEGQREKGLLAGNRIEIVCIDKGFVWTGIT